MTEEVTPYSIFREPGPDRYWCEQHLCYHLKEKP